jgi:hypothetical protein
VSVAYSRSNATVLWHVFDDGAGTLTDLPANISSAQILEAYDALLQDTTLLQHQNGTSLPLFSSSMFATFLWLIEPVFSGVDISPSTIGDTVYVALQSLVAIPIYFCQSGIAMRLVPYALTAKSVSNSLLQMLYDVLRKPPARTTPLTFASHRYEVVASYPTLVAYLALSGAAVLACFVVHLCLAVRGWRTSPLSRFPALDLLTHCSVEDGEQRVLYRGHSSARLQRQQEHLTTWLATLRVRWAQGDVERLLLPVTSSESKPTTSRARHGIYMQAPGSDSEGQWGAR